ncbi:MAG: GAF domain-containing protein [Anaerolineales bacterium]|nr:GAF domain-containing protein [Anaerolineales bacterium]
MSAETTKTKQSRSLTRTLAISFFSLSALALLLSSSLQITLAVQAQQTELENRLSLLAQDAGKSVSSFIQEKLNIMQVAVEFSEPTTASPSDQLIALQAILGLDPAFKQVILLDDRGNQLNYVSRVTQSLSTQFASQITNDVLSLTKEGKSHIGSVYIDENTSEPLILLAIPITTALGEYQGTLATEVNLKFIWDLVDQIDVGDTGYAYIVDPQGTLVAYRDTALVLQGTNASHIREVMEFMENMEEPVGVAHGSHMYEGLNSDTVVGTHVHFETPQWAVVVEIPWREAYENVITLGIRSLFLILVIAAFAGLAGNIGARRTSAPLVKLSNVAAEISKGNLHARATESGAIEFVQLASAFNAMTSQLGDLIGSLEHRVAERTADLEQARLQSESRARDLQSISEISRIISSEQRLNILLPLITRLVSEKFGFYHAGIFLIDESRSYAVLQAANSEGGQRMLNRGHRLELGTGIVGNVAATGKTRIALDVGVDAVFFDNPDLPATRSEMALPLNVRGETIGALDVQSAKAGAFTENESNIFGILADQIAIAIENARLFARTQQALTEAQTLYSQYLQKEWKAFRSKAPNVGYRQAPTGGKPLQVPLETDEIRQALQQGETVVSKENGSQTEPAMIVPIKLRGETIGVLNIKAPVKDHTWSKDEIGMIESVSERLALALENARLFEETTRRAERERLVSEITGKIRSVNDPQAMIQTALDELRSALGASRVQVIPQSPEGNANQNKTNNNEEV